MTCRSARWRRLVNDLVAQRDAVIADEDAWTRDQAANLVLPLAAKGAPRIDSLTRHDRLSLGSHDNL
jgi:hypothetical protein